MPKTGPCSFQVKISQIDGKPINRSEAEIRVTNIGGCFLIALNEEGNEIRLPLHYGPAASSAKELFASIAKHGRGLELSEEMRQEIIDSITRTKAAIAEARKYM